PQYVVNRIADILNIQKKSINGSKILILGIAYKKDVADTRESPAWEIIRLLRQKQAKISYNDPYVRQIKYQSLSLKSIKITAENIANYDCVVIIAAHSVYDHQLIASNAKVIVDTRNALKNIKGVLRKKIVLL
ncbi:MAG: UDP-N-acetyl-D-glucosamine dehydrogenase, partial [Candidatus Omnitrophota bacterium]